MNGTLWALVLYLAGMVAIGLWAARRSGRNLGEFYLGGRRMRDFVVALSAVVSGRSAWLMMGVVGLTFVYGVRIAWFIPGYVTMELFMFLYAGRRLRRFTGRYGNVTFIDYLATRFGDRRGVLRVVAVVIVIIFFTAYVGAQLKAGQIMFNDLLGWESVLKGIVLVAAVVGAYTILGGFRAVSLTDVVQALFMILGLVVLPIVGFAVAGGPVTAWSTLQEAVSAPGSVFELIGFGSLAGVVSGLGIGLASPGNPHIVVRYMSIDRPERLRMAALVGTVWNVLLGWGAVFTGLAARALYDPAVIGDAQNRAFLHMSTELFPPFAAGLLMAALLAAIMSTADSQLLVISSSITRDLRQGVFGRGRAMRDTVAVTWGRVSVGAVVVAAALLSWVSAGAAKGGVFSTVFSYVLLAWSGLGASFGPPLLASLYWRRVTWGGALASLISGTAGCILWVASGLKARTDINEILPAFALSTLLLVVVSLLTRPPAEADEFLGAMAPTGQGDRTSGGA